MAANVGKRNKGDNYKADSAFYSLSGFPYAFQVHVLWSWFVLVTNGGSFDNEV